MKNLVAWPVANLEVGYRDSGEGGLFAYATWSLRPEDVECVVDVHPTLGVGDVRVHSVGPDAVLFEEQSRALHSLHYSKFDDYISAVESLGFSVNAVLFLGSTSESLFDDVRGDYFHVDRNSLTPEGLALVSALEAVYGEQATFTTYLDT